MKVLWTEDPQDKVFYFHLKGVTVDSVYLNSNKTSAVVGGIVGTNISYYSIVAPINAKIGDTFYVKVNYSGTMTCETGGTAGWCGGVTSQNGTLYTLGVGFVADYVSTTQHWLPCYDHPSDKATFHAKFKVPRGKIAVSNGNLTNVEADNTTITTEWTHDIPCATYLLTFAVDLYFPLEFGSSQLPMTVYSKGADTASTRKSFSLLPRMVRTFENKFGEYPFEKVGYVNTPTGAMEHQTMISFPTSLSQSRDTVNSVAAHELAHQWFGDNVTPEDFRDAWLTESFATYSESVWAEELGGFTGYLNNLSGKMSSYFNANEGVFPLYDYPRAAPSSNYPVTIYSKGAVVLGMLRYEVGDSLFYKSLKQYLSAYKYGIANTATFENMFQQTTGKDLKWFFSQWVHAKGWVKLDIRTSQTTNIDGKKVTNLRFVQTQPKDQGPFTNIPIEVGVKQKDGKYLYTIFTLKKDDETFTLPVEFPTDYTAITINQGPTLRTLLQVVSLTEVIENPKEERPELRIIPNPAGSDFQLDYCSEQNGSAVIVITNVEGKQLYKEIITVHQGQQKITLHNTLSSGMYWLSIEQNGRESTKQFVIQQ
ncbi:MAG: T9SS type A sorting domain-containing protein [Ignavibacteria bacterium]|nr:T9SS type A sorting domain-containing protein [Ignavibacteria bacterium]